MTSHGLNHVPYSLLQEAAKHYAMSTELDHPFNFDGKESLVVQ